MMNQIFRRERIGAQADVVAPQPHELDDEHAPVRMQIDRDAVQALECLAYDARAPR